MKKIWYFYFRYFECKPMFGLFAPIHKVTRLTSGTAGPGKPATTPTSQSRSLMNTSLRLSKERSGSQESVSSISSSASSVSRSRVRLGVTSLGNQVHAVYKLNIISFRFGFRVWQICIIGDIILFFKEGILCLLALVTLLRIFFFKLRCLFYKCQWGN